MGGAYHRVVLQAFDHALLGWDAAVLVDACAPADMCGPLALGCRGGTSCILTALGSIRTLLQESGWQVSGLVHPREALLLACGLLRHAVGRELTRFLHLSGKSGGLQSNPPCLVKVAIPTAIPVNWVPPTWRDF